MIRILKWAVVVFLVFVFLTEVVPRIRERVEGVTRGKVAGRPDPMTGEASGCVYLAVQANIFVGDEAHGAKPPPGDSSGWAEVGDEIRQRIATAEDACTCPQPGCSTARKAMEELGVLVDDINRMISGQMSVVGSPGSQQERINALLDQAQVEAR